MSHPLKIRGAHGSPYSLKMRAVLRYRQIPFRWVPQGSKWDDMPPFPLIPAISFPDETGAYVDTAIDSSPLIMRLEQMYQGRSLVPNDPAVAFLDYLIEDYADEWMTKQMYHYRWYYDEAISKAGKLLPLDSDQQMPDENHARGQGYITKRQISRRALVGSTEQNRPAIEESYERILDLLNTAITAGPHLLGNRPGRGDFGVYGQLTQLVRWDPVSVRIAIERAPRVVHWVERVDDLSWWDVTGDEGWVDRDGIGATTLALLPEIGKTYAPFLLANAKAIDAGEETMSVMIDGNEYSQGTFTYQHKCLRWIREEHQKLSAADRQWVDRVLAGTGCETLFTA